MTISTEELRKNVDQAMIYAPSKWSSQAYRIAEAYAMAYDNQTTTLANIQASKRAEAELASFMLSLILPGLLGGFAGALLPAMPIELSRNWSINLPTSPGA